MEIVKLKIRNKHCLVVLSFHLFVYILAVYYLPTTYVVVSKSLCMFLNLEQPLAKKY